MDSYFNLLPDELLNEIISYLNPSDLLSIYNLNHNRFNYVLSLLIKRYYKKYDYLDSNISFKEKLDIIIKIMNYINKINNLIGKVSKLNSEADIIIKTKNKIVKDVIIKNYTSNWDQDDHIIITILNSKYYINYYIISETTDILKIYISLDNLIDILILSYTFNQKIYLEYTDSSGQDKCDYLSTFL